MEDKCPKLQTKKKPDKSIAQKHFLRIVQLNMNGQFIVAEQLRDYCIDKNVDIALVKEPPTRGGV
jgi:hypothetical protein